MLLIVLHAAPMYIISYEYGICTSLGRLIEIYHRLDIGDWHQHRLQLPTGKHVSCVMESYSNPTSAGHQSWIPKWNNFIVVQNAPPRPSSKYTPIAELELPQWWWKRLEVGLAVGKVTAYKL